jgi:double-strand break repair protein MRE11
MLSVAGMVNYFGKCEDVDDILVSPVLLIKGTTHLALFGIGNVRDERLHRTFLRKRVRMIRPVETEEKWFNLLVLHQNHHMHSSKNGIPESFLHDFLDLVIWGHEHECLVKPQYNSERGFYVSQPGSSVATSLVEGEAVPKYETIIQEIVISDIKD